MIAYRRDFTMEGDLGPLLQRAEGELERSTIGSPQELGERRRRLRLDLLRQHLTAGLHALKARHVGGAAGHESVQEYAGFIDGLLRIIWERAEADCRREGLPPEGPVVLVALGGYGRGELGPSSDIDLMVIHRGESPALQRITQELLYTLWDLGLQVGHSVRSLEDCQAIARTDLLSRTSMMEARYIAGDKALFRAFGKTLAENVYRKDFARFLEDTLAERDSRYRKHGASVYGLEPNVKESAGGLRDVHTAMWLASAKFKTRTLKELEEKGFVTGRERQATDAALTFLWRVRNELHFISGHKNDVLSRPIQAQIAKNFGYTDDEQSLGVEKFMREYYRHARAIHRFATRLIHRCRETIGVRRSLLGRFPKRGREGGLVFYDSRVHLEKPDRRAFREDPTRLMRVFWHAHRLGYDLSLDVERAIEENLDLIGDEFWASHDVRNLFLSICRNWGRVAGTLRQMHELGVLGRYIPEFGGLDCLVQYDAYHKHTADQHSLLGVEYLEALAPGGGESEDLSKLVTELERPELLILGMLLHDIGKSQGHGHVAKGIPLIRAVTQRMGLDPRGAAGVEFLVTQHLLMSHTIQRRDLDDPKTIEAFARACGDPEWVRMIYLLTVADMRAVGPGVWTAWRGSLLLRLYERAVVSLTGGIGDEGIDRELLLERVLVESSDTTWEGVAAHLDRMSERYLTTTPPQRMAAHLRLIAQLANEPVATEVFPHPGLGTSDFVVVAPDAPGLFSLMVGTLAANEINILSAQIHTRADGIAVDTFQISDPYVEVDWDDRRWERVREELRSVITGEGSVEELLLARRGSRRFPSEAPPLGPIKVTVDNHLSDSYTVIEVKCPDRLGLLYLITRTLAREGTDIGSAKITTEIDQAYDTFYVRDRQARKVEDPERLYELQRALEGALLSPL